MNKRGAHRLAFTEVLGSSESCATRRKLQSNDAGRKSRCRTRNNSEILDAKTVIDGMTKFLLASEVALSRLNR